MQLATDTTNFADGPLGLVELALSYLNDRSKKFNSKPEMVIYINLAQQELAGKINRLYDQFFLTSATTPTVANQSFYSLPSDLMQHMGIEVGETVFDNDPKQMVEVHFSDRDFAQRLAAVNDKADLGFYFIQGSGFKLMPPDSAAGKAIRIFYIKRLPDLVANADVSQIPLEHHELLAVMAARRARIKLNSRHPSLDQAYMELTQSLEDSLQLSPLAVEQARPFWPCAPGDNQAI